VPQKAWGLDPRWRPRTWDLVIQAMIVAVVRETPVALAADVAAALIERGPELGGHDILLLPRVTRQGQTLYVPEDLDAPSMAREAGLDAAFLHDGPLRRYLHENAATAWELQCALAIGQTVSAAGIIALAKYFRARVRRAQKEGVYEGEEAAAPVKVTVAHFEEVSSTRALTISAVQFAGPLDDVCEVISRYLQEGRPDQVDHHERE